MWLFLYFTCGLNGVVKAELISSSLMKHPKFFSNPFSHFLKNKRKGMHNLVGEDKRKPFLSWEFFFLSRKYVLEAIICVVYFTWKETKLVIIALGISSNVVRLNIFLGIKHPSKLSKVTFPKIEVPRSSHTVVHFLLSDFNGTLLRFFFTNRAC